MTTPTVVINVSWTEKAKQGLKGLPKYAQIGLLDAIETLQTCDNPTTQDKQHVGPLKSLNRIRYSRYRAIFSTTKEEQANGESIIIYSVLFVAVGIRKEKSKQDIYFVAKKLVDKGIFVVTDFPKITRPGTN